MKRFMDLRTLFAVNFAIIIIILTIITSTVISIRSTEEYKNEIGDMLAETSFQMSDKLDHYMWSRYNEVSLLSKLDDLKDINNSEKIRNLLEELKGNVPEYSWIGMVDPTGKVIASTGRILEGNDISSRPVYKEALNGPFIGDVHEAVLLAKLLPNPTGETMKFVDISIPIKDSAGNLKGILASHLSWEWAKEIESSIMQPLEKRKDLEVFIVSNKENTVLLGPKEMIGEKVNLKSIDKSKNGENSWMVESWQDGKEYLTGYVSENGYKNYKGLGWTIIVRQPTEVAYYPVENLKNFIIIVGVVSAVFFAIVGWITAGIIVKPLRKLTLAANQVRIGNKVEIPKYKGIKDIEILSRSLGSLVESLINTESRLGSMENIATHDQLTGIPNRVALKLYLEEMKKIVLDEKLILTFFYLDLDGFKPINDIYGHDSGDLILKEVAKRLKDNVGEREIAVRMGGDEFVVIKCISSDKPIEDSEKFANKLIEQIRKPYLIKDIVMNVGCSIGGAFYPLQGSDPMDVLCLSDKGLYMSKEAGKNRYTFVK